MSGIVVVGAVFVDIKGFPEAAYIPTGKNAGRVEYVHGGVSRNVCEDLCNIGIDTTYLSVVDDSALGKEVIERLKEKNINTEYIDVKENGMGTWLVVFNEEGDVAGSISQRPDITSIDEVLDKYGDEIFKDCDSAVIEIDMEEKTVDKIIALCKKYNKKLFGVVSNIQEVIKRRELVQNLDCFVCNQLEASLFFSKYIQDLGIKELEVALKERVMAANIKSIVVTAGDHGAVYASMDGDSGIVPARTVKVKDTTGAGDSFCAGVAAGLTYGCSLREAVEIGTRIASSVIVTRENVCPIFRSEELGLKIEKE
ncbi:MAG: PfkB family carbohydrate kinase [Erysipelotrichaceae bacterium]|nr:PfkB family carbohydrate kinase [Erysipelotrichaceae bacterium]